MHRFKSSYGRLKPVRESGDKPGTFDWLLHLAHKRWLNEDDIRDLNTAFMAALYLFVPKSKKGKLSLAKTLEEQQRILGYKNMFCRRLAVLG
ncbi:MAG: hypothetical protein JST19_15320 [Bacteroidetes bacterium]|nr:hypothetical protein [Bacteroidota bacterium]